MSFLGIIPSSVNRRLLFFGIFLASLSGLVLEIAITRIFSAAIWYHFAFVAVSVALVGLGASGLLVHYRLKKIKENWAGDLTIASSIGIVVVLPLATGSSLYLVLNAKRFGSASVKSTHVILLSTSFGCFSSQYRNISTSGGNCSAIECIPRLAKDSQVPGL